MRSVHFRAEYLVLAGAAQVLGPVEELPSDEGAPRRSGDAACDAARFDAGRGVGVRLELVHNLPERSDVYLQARRA